MCLSAESRLTVASLSRRDVELPLHETDDNGRLFLVLSLGPDSVSSCVVVLLLAAITDASRLVGVPKLSTMSTIHADDVEVVR